MIRVKICGINDAAARAAAIAAGADWLGFVFFPPSPRAVTPAQASGLAVGAPGCVGLFVRPTDADIAATLGAVRLDVLQIYDTAIRCAEIRARFAIPVWRAVGIATEADLPAEAGGVDGFVIEAKPPAGATRPGGNASVFDWTALAGWRAPLPWLLAGGLTPGNVAAAIVAAGAPAVDVSSGVERAPGVKDSGLIRAFVAAARAAADQPCFRHMARQQDN